MNLGQQVMALLRRHPAVSSVSLAGSRVGGSLTQLSDWDIHVDADDLEALDKDLPELMSPLRPLGQQWDRLSDRWNYMLLLPGPVKVDLIFEQPYEKKGPWVPDATNLGTIQHHFCDWILWLGSKQLRGKTDLIAIELVKMHDHLLGPLGVADRPATLEQAMAAFRSARGGAELRFGVTLDHAMEEEVARALTDAGVLGG